MGRVPDNIVISPGPGRPDVPEDFGMCAQALKEAVDIPILGVCLGHEGLGIEHGATVTHAAEPMHGRLSPIFHDDEDPLFRGVPQGSRVVRYHSLVVDRDTLPANGFLKATAWTGDGVLMAMRHKRRPHWGVQFHPESVGTRHGTDIVRNFRDLTVAWRGAAAARDVDVGIVSGNVGVGVECGVSGNTAASRRETPGRVARDEAERRREARAAAIPGDVPEAGPPALFPDNPLGAADASTPVADASLETARKLTSRKRRPFVLLVEEVEMAGGALNSEGEEGTPNGGRQAVPGAVGSAMPDTEHAFRALYGDDPTAWWLDSSSQRPGLAVDGQAKARFTFMGGADGPLSQTIECYGDDRLVIRRGGGRDAGSSSGDCAEERREVRANIMDYLRAEMAKMGHASNADDSSSDRNSLEIRMVGGQEDNDSSLGGGASVGDRTATPDTERPKYTLPFDFLGGFVGFLGYELRHEANTVLARSAGGTEWDWQAPNGERWEDTTFESEEAVERDGLGVVVDGTGRDDVSGVGDVPLGFLIFVDRFVAFDHQEGKAYVLALAHDNSSLGGERDGGGTDVRVAVPGEYRGRDQPLHKGATTAANDSERDDDHHKDAVDWVGRTASFLRDLSSTSLGDIGKEGGAARGARIVGTTCAMDVPRSRYEESLEEIMRLVGEGETYEVCLTNQIVCNRPKREGGAAFTPPLDLYSRLRRSNPAPYAAYIVHDPQRRLSAGGGVGDGVQAGSSSDGPSFAVCCSSPEKFLKVDGDGWVESKPIKGTVKR